MKTKTQTRTAFLHAVVQARAVEADLAKLEQAKAELHNRWVEHASRAGMAAETLGYGNFKEALESVTEEEIAKTEADLMAEQASQNGAG